MPSAPRAAWIRCPAEANGARHCRRSPTAATILGQMNVILVAILLSALPEQGQIEITADKQERNQNIFRYTGNVVATYQDMHVEADLITYDDATKEITEADHVR